MISIVKIYIFWHLVGYPWKITRFYLQFFTCNLLRTIDFYVDKPPGLMAYLLLISPLPLCPVMCWCLK